MMSDRRIPPARRDSSERRKRSRRSGRQPVPDNRRAASERRRRQRRSLWERRGRQPRRSLDRLSLEPSPYTDEHLRRLRLFLMAGQSQISCPACVGAIVVDDRIEYGKAVFWELHCDECQRSATVSNNPKRASILIVESDATAREAFTAILSKAGHLVSAESDHGAVFQRYQARPTDLVLVDIAAGGGSGLPLMRRLIRDLGATVVAIAPRRRAGVPDAMAMAHGLEVCGILRKPCDRSDVLGVVSNAIL